MTSAEHLLRLEQMIPGDGAPAIALTFEGRQLHPDLRRNGVAPVERLPLPAHPVLVDRWETQLRDQRPSFRKAHAITAAVVRENLLVLRIVANALHQVVVVDDERAQAKLLGSKRDRRPEWATTDNQDVEDFRERDRRVKYQRAV